MGNMKSLAKDTAIYGLSSIVGRFLNWCLVPLYTIKFPAEEYGIVTYIYAVVALALIILTYGMETGFFRFANHERWKNPMQVYSTVLISLAVSSTVFMAAASALSVPLADWLQCGDHPSYVWLMAVCVGVDAFTSIPFCYLRYKKRPIKFALLKFLNIGLNIGLNLFFILLCPWLMDAAPATVDWFYRPDYSVGYVFLANFISSIAMLALLVPELTGFRWTFCGKLWQEMLRYSAPLLVLGVAGIMNQTLDKIIFPLLYTGPDSMAELGIYGANYKIAIVMVMFIQAFRFAYEPFIFAQNKKEGLSANKSYADAMKYFIIAAIAIFMIVMFYLDILRYFISPKYFSGLKVVPIVMIAELFFGIFFNLSVWYKLSDKTMWGVWFSLFGLAVTIAMNVILVPRYSYMGCAWGAFICYGSMMIASYFVGQAKRPIDYHLKRIGTYVIMGAALYAAGMYLLATDNHLINWIVRAILLGIYATAVCKIEHIHPATMIKAIARK